MPQIIETIYIIGAIAALAAGAPQVKKLLMTKASDEFSLTTWTTWLATQCTALLYVSVFATPLMVAVNMIWVAFYCLMLVLIVRYRPREPQRIAIYDAPE